MPIYRCNHCGFISEEANAAIGASMSCARCGTAATVFGTVFYVEKLVERYFAAMRELKALREVEVEIDTTSQAPAEVVPGETDALRDVDLNNTSLLATAEQHAPLQQWFASHQIEARFNYALADTSGFFDDAAQLIGERHELFGELIERVRWAYRKSHTWVNLELGGLAQKDAQAINALCRQLYGHTLFARYYYQKPEKIVRLTLQGATAVRQFFDGGWLEWYAFMVLIRQFQESNKTFSCARGVKVVFPNEDLHELDVVGLPAGQAPVCIECKSGEFRRDIEKYVRLRKRLGLDKSRFILCVADLSEEQAAGLSGMYDLSFVNLRGLAAHLQHVLA
ncbi:hypothetical protein [Comamonas sp. NLF-1-9]|uniref:hypothetical protein n=1 Tax=Comamonas sp. NLF-1-9 TaxID=2853163 RepID=UPI001C479D9B|nr:hypothetical protein [Comamonas sp. NLF-1-9]QXL83381.1 hypothetical protein KUD94_08880 [Comamonas sp. NLF-1-9]